MKIYSIELIKSVPAIKDFSSNLPKIIVFGKSNVGKSSFINSILQNKKIARVSSTPGKTALFHFFLINKSFFLVDIPGYGYAKAPLLLKKHWEKQFQILLKLKDIKLIIHLLDIRHLPSKLDQYYHCIIQKGTIPYTIIATKFDCLSKQKRKIALHNLEKNLQKKVLPFSIKEKETRKDIWQGIQQIL